MINSEFYSKFNNNINFLKLFVKIVLKLIQIKDQNNQNKKSKKINIYINDWLTSALFPFNLFLGLLLKKNFKIVFLFDEYNLYNYYQSKFINFGCELILKYIKKKFKIEYIILGNSPLVLKNKRSKFKTTVIDNMYKFNLFRYNQDVGSKINKNQFYYKKRIHALKIFDHIEQLIQNKIISKNDVNFISGGYLNSSYLLNQLFRKYKINFYSYDSRPFGKRNSVFYCKNGIAGKMEESFEAFKNLKSQKYFNKLKLKKIKKLVFNELKKKRLNKSNIEHFQVSKKYNVKNMKFAMITINSGWDANSLDSDYIFSSYLNFLIETVNYFKKKFPKIKLIIKNHPHRKNGIIKQDSIERLSKKIASKNIIFLDSDQANFYDLIKKCKLLISVASTSLNESIIFDIPAISAGKDQYYHFKLGINPSSKKDFFKEIKDVLNGERKSDKVIYEKAIIFYYLIHIKKFLVSEFNPQNASWLNLNFDELKNSTHIRIVKKMILSNKTFLETKLINKK